VVPSDSENSASALALSSSGDRSSIWTSSTHGRINEGPAVVAKVSLGVGEIEKLDSDGNGLGTIALEVAGFGVLSWSS